MTGEALYNQLLSFADLEVERSAVVGWINTAQTEVSTEIPVTTTESVGNVMVGTVYTSPNGIFKIVSASSDGGDYPLHEILVYGNTVKFNHPANNVTITYKGVAPKYTDLAQELTIHPSLRGPMIYYLLSIQYDQEGEGDPEESGMAERFYQRWMYYKALVARTVSMDSLYNNIPDPVATSDVLPKRNGWRGDNFYE